MEDAADHRLARDAELRRPRANGVDAEQILEAPRRLLEEARRNFDVILIDSGSVLGSIEATVLAPEVDGVIMAVTRGQQQQLVERSIHHLRPRE